MRLRSIAIAISTVFLAAHSITRSHAAGAAGEIGGLGTIRNVVLIIADDMNIWPTEDGRPGDLYPGAVSTPNIDALANRGHLFQQAFANSPLCSPSRASFLSGRTPFETQVFDNLTPWLDKLVPAQTLPAVMKSAGFTVGLFGKVFHAMDLQEPFLSVVSDEFLADTTHFFDSAGHRFGSGPADYPTTEHGDFINTSAAIRFIQRHKTQPFFLALGLFKPHAPFVVPANYFGRYPAAVTRPTSLSGDMSDVPAYPQRRYASSNSFFNWCSTGDCWNSIVKAYLASMSFADAMIGRLVQAVSDSGLSGSTAIVFIGDNGYHLGEKTMFGKDTLWNEAVRVPMIIVDPTRPGPATVPATVQLLDIYPTILQLAGVPVPDWASGKTLVPWLTDPARPRPSVVSSVHDGLLVQTGRFAYMRYGDGAEEFYDLATDPYQQRNGVSGAAEARQLMAERARQYATQQRLFLADANVRTVNGTPLNDTLSGALDGVVLAGGAGDDTYILHNSTVRISERPGEGVDTVIADTSYALPPGVENLYVNALAPDQAAKGNDLANSINLFGERASIYDGGGVDVLNSLSNDVRYVLTPRDNAVDTVYFRSAQQQKIDLRLFGASQTCSFDAGVLTVNGEQVARILGDFALARDVVNGCAGGTLAASAPPAPSLSRDDAIAEPNKSAADGELLE